jgi:glycerophosphoryl diester phosphodiesterase
MSLGVDGVEIDVRCLHDALIVLHDDTLDRTTNGHGGYKAMALSALRALDAGHGESIPLLEEVIALSQGRVMLNIEVKEAGIAEQVIERTLAATTALPAWRERILLSSFDVDTSAVLARLRGPMRMGLLYEEDFPAALARATRLGASSLHMALEHLDAADVARAQAHGLAVYIYTVNDASAIARCHAAAVDGVFSDYPERVIAARRDW